MSPEESRSLRPRNDPSSTWGFGRPELPPAPVFYPTEEEFSDFNAYVNSIAKEAANSGIVKIVPPASWQRPSEAPPSDSFVLDSAIRQHISGSSGLYSIINQLAPALSYDRFSRQAEAYAAKDHVQASVSLNALEEKFWNELVGSQPPLYGADVDGTLFPPSIHEFNPGILPDMLRQGPTSLVERMNGINTPMLYFGGWRCIFSLHVEDMDLVGTRPPPPRSLRPRPGAPRASTTQPLPSTRQSTPIPAPSWGFPLTPRRRLPCPPRSLSPTLSSFRSTTSTTVPPSSGTAHRQRLRRLSRWWLLR